MTIHSFLRRSSLLVAAIWLAHVVLISTGTAEDWSTFRGPTRMGVADTQLPTQWSDTNNIVWKAELPGPGSSSPVVFGNRIFVTSYNGYFPDESRGTLDKLQRQLIAVDANSGQVVWTKSIAAAHPEEERIRDHGYAGNSPAVDDKHVYAFFGKSGVYAFDHDGKQVWHADVGSQTNGWGSAASPVLYQDLVIINASVESESLVALDRNSGKEIWRTGDIRESWNTPIIAKSAEGRDELIVARHGDVLAFNPKDGSPLWTCKTDITWYMVPSGVAADGVVYFFGGRSGTASLAVRLGGQGDVTDSHRLWTSSHGTNVSSPIYHDGHLYWMHDQLGIAFCAKADSGELVYRERLERADQVYSSPVLAAGKLYYLTRSGTTFVIAARPEFELIATNQLEGKHGFDGSPAVIQDRLLIRSAKFMYCIGQ
ncbi:MAG: PQQ-like beta-propeller repeat protein [Planctomycetales bacterium]|nr:PQQ-like beta-propeller repeat protein [Planctomycetales bacterium]